MISNIKDTLVLNQNMLPVSMIPPSTVSWKTAIKVIYTGAAQIVHEYDDWVVHSPSIQVNVPSIIMLNEYIHFDKFIPWNKDLLKLRDEYKCQYCDKEFSSHLLTMDHVLPRKYGGVTSYENIVSACSPCNQKRGHDVNIRPKNEPHKPEYWELVSKIKKLPLVIPDKEWSYYLQWTEKNIFIKEKQNKILHCDSIR